MADVQQQPALLNPAQVLGGQQQPQQNGGRFGFLKSLVVRAVLIYLVTSYFRKSPAPAGNVDTPGPDGKMVASSSRSSGNLYVNGTIFDLYVYVSEDKLRPNFDHPGELIWMQPELVYGDWTSGEAGDGSYMHKVRVPLSTQVQNNASLWLHTYFVPTKASPNSKTKGFDGTYTLHRVKQLNKYKKRSFKKTHNLLTGETAASVEDQEKMNSNIEQEILSHWHPNLTINIIDDHTPWVRGQVPGPLQDFVQFELITGKYYPIVYMNDYWNLIRDYQPINDTVKEIELRLTFQPMSLLKWQLYTAQAMRSKWSTMLGTDLMEQDEEEQDVLKETMLETSVVLLALTIIISITHSVFEFLAFKNDIQFWRDRRSLEGLSVRSVFFNVFQSMVVMLYVWDNDTNFMIKISVVIGLVIELWKIKQVVNIERVQGETWFGGLVPKVRITDKGSYVESSTREYDNLAFKYLSWALFPLFVGYAIYSLLYNEHKGWYSFVLNMVYGFLLTFGFIMMTPQLFINYKLKSVAHLPWRMLTYKFLNTFIDDIFAFVIKMPTMYRLGCFRDDIIFLIFAYQRWIYRVDHSRVNEFGVSGDDLAQADLRRQQQPGEVSTGSQAIAGSEQSEVPQETEVDQQESKKDK